MKKILSLLTLALLGAATTVSAATHYDYYGETPYYSYFENASVSDYTATGINRSDNNKPYQINGKTIDYGDYAVIKCNYPTDPYLKHESTFKVRIDGDNVSLYLGDFVNSAEKGGNSGSLQEQKVDRIGYRILDATDKTRIGKIDQFDLKAEATPFETKTVDPLNQWNPDTGYTVTRNKYYLGTFQSGDVIELYMERDGKGAWSYSDWWASAYGDNYPTDGDPVYTQADKLMMEHTADNAAAAAKALPLAALNPERDGEGSHRVYFALITSDAPAGSPLPGGVQIALIAGLFGLGFWYVRRRKAVTA